MSPHLTIYQAQVSFGFSLPSEKSEIQIGNDQVNKESLCTWSIRMAIRLVLDTIADLIHLFDFEHRLYQLTSGLSIFNRITGSALSVGTFSLSLTQFRSVSASLPLL